MFVVGTLWALTPPPASLAFVGRTARSLVFVGST
jgi:hypothetical protein